MTDSAGGILVRLPAGSQTGVDAAASGYDTNSRTNKTGVKVRRAATLLSVVGVTVGLLSACGGSSPKPAASTSAAPPTTAAPATSSAVAPSTTAAPATTSVPPATTATSSPAATPTSKYESDDAIKQLRKYMYQAAKSVNGGGHFNEPALTALEVPAFVPLAKENFADDVKAKLHYPGPQPFTPIAAQSFGVTRRQYNICIIGKGFAVDPKTNRPVSAVHIVPLYAQMELDNGTWRVAGLPSGNFSCTGVNVAEESF